MKKKWNWIALALLICFAVVLFLYRSGNIGLSEQTMRREVAENTYMGDGDTLLCDIGDSMAVFFLYNTEKDHYDLDVYVKRKHSIGWFFRYGGATSSVSGPCDGLYRMEVEGNGEYVLFGLNTTPVEWIEVEMAPDYQRIISLEDGKPFAYVMDREWNVTVYSPGSVVLEPVERNL